MSRDTSSGECTEHWSAPRVDLTAENIGQLLKYVERHSDDGVFRLFKQLANMEQGYRLAKNLSETLRVLAASCAPISDALCGGITKIEDRALVQLETSGISIDLLGVAHVLLDIRERQRLILRFGDTFYKIRIKN